MVDICRREGLDLDLTKPFVLFHSGVFSQWHKAHFKAPFVVGLDTKTCRQWSSCEQYMMACKAVLFGDSNVLRKILATSNVRTIKALGRQVRGFKNKVWNANKFQIVVEGNYAKFSQNVDLKNRLLGTQNRVIAEASPRDDIWGIGLHEQDEQARDIAHWRGQNLLGQALMVVRSRVLNETAEAVSVVNGSVQENKRVGDSSSTSAASAPNAGEVAFASEAPPGLPQPSSAASDPESQGMATWPMDKIKAKLRCLANDADGAAAGSQFSTGVEVKQKARRPKCILLSTGALNPVHRGHVAMLLAAQQHLEKEKGFDVLGGFLSPSSDCYVRPKCQSKRTFFVPGLHRAAMAAKCVEGSVFSVSTWEIQHTETWPDFPEVCAELCNVIEAEFPREDILIVYVCGTDHARHCGGLLRQKNTGVCVVRRDGSDGECALTSQPWNLFRTTHATSETSTVASFSSTHVRKLLAEFWRGGKRSKNAAVKLAEVIGAPTLEYIVTNSLYKA